MTKTEKQKQRENLPNDAMGDYANVEDLIQKQKEHKVREVQCTDGYRVICTCGWSGQKQQRLRYAGDDFDEHLRVNGNSRMSEARISSMERC